jgi:hypothetical protein
MRFAGHVVRIDGKLNTFRISVENPQGTLSARTAVPLNLLTMQSQPHTLEIPDFCLVIEMFMDFRKFGFLQYPFYLNNIYSLI